MKKFINYTHRGASSYAPENTMSAFELAIKQGANGIELDLRKTKDKKIVIFHDEKIDNKSNSKGKLKNYTYEELCDIDFGSWFDKKYKGEPIVLFEDFAKKFLKKKITFAIELKETGYEEKVLEIIKKYSNTENIYISSFKFKTLKNIRKLDKNIKISWLIKEKITKRNIRKLLKINGNEICPKAIHTTHEDINIATTYGIQVRLWGIKDEEIMKEAYELNAVGMTVNFPDKLKKYMENKNI